MKKLFLAIRHNDLQQVKDIISKKPDLVHCTAKQPPKKDDGQSPLQVALKTGNFDIARYGGGSQFHGIGELRLQ